MSEPHSQSVRLAAMTMEHYARVFRLWEAAEVALRPADAADRVARYLARNPGLSVVALFEARIVGVAMAGHDGRCGFIQRVAVDADWRRRGIAQRMVAFCLAGLMAEAVTWVHLDVVVGNATAERFWIGQGFAPRDTRQRLSLDLEALRQAEPAESRRAAGRR